MEVFFPVANAGLGYKFAEVMEPLTKHFYAFKCEPSVLLSNEFISQLVETGELYALAPYRKLDVDTTLSLYPNGDLVLGLQKDTYVALGLNSPDSGAMKSKSTLPVKMREFGNCTSMRYPLSDLFIQSPSFEEIYSQNTNS